MSTNEENDNSAADAPAEATDPAAEAAPTETAPAPEAAPAPAPQAAKAGSGLRKKLMFGGLAAVVVIGLLILLLTGSSSEAGGLVKKMPASASVVMAADLGSITEDPALAQLVDTMTAAAPAYIKTLLEAMPITSIKTVACSGQKMANPFNGLGHGACIIKGEFDAEKAGAILADMGGIKDTITISEKNGWASPMSMRGSDDRRPNKDKEFASKAVGNKMSEKEGQAVRKGGNSERGAREATPPKHPPEFDATLLVYGEGALIVGTRFMVEKMVHSLDGTGKTIEENDKVMSALGNVDTGAMFVLAIEEEGKGTGALSVNMDSSLDVQAFAQVEDARMLQKLNEARAGFAMAKGVAPTMIDKGLESLPPALHGAVAGLADFAKEFVASVTIEEADGGVKVSASASLPEGGLFGAAAALVTVFLMKNASPPIMARPSPM